MPPMPPAGPLAVVADDILTKLTAAELDTIRAAAPIGLLDQIDAATRDGLLALADTDLFHTPGLRPVTDIPAWIRLGALTALAAWFTDRHSSCAHNPSAQRPQPVHAAAWKPCLIACPACLHLLRIPKNSPDDRRCDCCGHLTTGPDNGDDITPAAVVLGTLTYRVGVCNDCLF